MVVARDGCRTRWLSDAMVVARNVLSQGIGCRKELVVARNWLSQGIGCLKEFVVARIGSRTNWLSLAMFVPRDVCRKELVVARNWLSQGIGCRMELVVARRVIMEFNVAAGIFHPFATIKTIII